MGSMYMGRITADVHECLCHRYQLHMGGCVIRKRSEYGKNVHGENMQCMDMNIVQCMDMNIVQLHMGGMCNMGTM